MATAMACDFCGIVGSQSLENDRKEFNYEGLSVEKKRKASVNKERFEVTLLQKHICHIFNKNYNNVTF
jgi:hypothetical protein